MITIESKNWVQVLIISLRRQLAARIVGITVKREKAITETINSLIKACTCAKGNTCTIILDFETIHPPVWAGSVHHKEVRLFNWRNIPSLLHSSRSQILCFKLAETQCKTSLSGTRQWNARLSLLERHFQSWTRCRNPLLSPSPMVTLRETPVKRNVRTSAHCRSLSSSPFSCSIASTCRRSYQLARTLQ